MNEAHPFLRSRRGEAHALDASRLNEPVDVRAGKPLQVLTVFRRARPIGGKGRRSVMITARSRERGSKRLC